MYSMETGAVVAVEALLRWQQAYGEHAPAVWVNISCDQLGRQHLVGVVERLLSETGLATERQLARRVDDVANDLIALRALGVAMAVDDFGTGYASLDYLRRFTFDVTSSIIALGRSLGRSLGLTVVAEGVETQDQYDRL